MKKVNGKIWKKLLKITQKPLSTWSNQTAAADAAVHRHPQRRDHQSQPSTKPLISYAATTAAAAVCRQVSSQLNARLLDDWWRRKESLKRHTPQRPTVAMTGAACCLTAEDALEPKRWRVRRWLLSVVLLLWLLLMILAIFYLFALVSMCLCMCCTLWHFRFKLLLDFDLSLNYFHTLLRLSLLFLLQAKRIMLHFGSKVLMYITTLQWSVCVYNKSVLLFGMHNIYVDIPVCKAGGRC